MTEEFKQYQSTIKKVPTYGINPKFEESFSTDLEEEYFLPVVVAVFEQLGWHNTIRKPCEVHAKIIGEYNVYSEYVRVSYSEGIVNVESSLLGRQIRDGGRNSVRVRLFVYAYKKFLKSSGTDAIQKMKEEFEREEEMLDYVIPQSLPKPNYSKKYLPLWLVILGSSVLLGLSSPLTAISIMFPGGLMFSIALSAIIMRLSLTALVKLSVVDNRRTLDHLILFFLSIYFLSEQLFLFYPIFEHNQELTSLSLIIDLHLKANRSFLVEYLGGFGLLLGWLFKYGALVFLSTSKSTFLLDERLLKKSS